MIESAYKSPFAVTFLGFSSNLHGKNLHVVPPGGFDFQIAFAFARRGGHHLEEKVLSVSRMVDERRLAASETRTPARRTARLLSAVAKSTMRDKSAFLPPRARARGGGFRGRGGETHRAHDDDDDARCRDGDNGEKYSSFP